MLESVSYVRLFEWNIKEKHFLNFTFYCLIGHQSNDLVYGALYKINENQYVFQQHKWIELNKGKSVPKVVAEINYKHKLVGPEIWNSFKKLDQAEYFGREINDEKSLF